MEKRKVDRLGDLCLVMIPRTLPNTHKLSKTSVRHKDVKHRYFSAGACVVAKRNVSSVESAEA
jgi:hypothetical protein